MGDLLWRIAAALETRYAVERELGRGGMGIVFLARELRHDRLVAIKVLQPELAATVGPDRFLREMQIAARLTHTHILPLYDSGAAGGFLYYTMPYVAGGSLRERLQREHRIPVSDALTITRQTASALDCAHRNGLVHRDVKPENVLLQEHAAVLTDFGIARAVDGVADDVTAPGMVVGTPAYMSPEQASADRPLDSRSDLYSLGCVLYEMLAGVPPFTGPTSTAIIARKTASRPAGLRTLNPDVPAAVERAVATVLSPNPDDRFASGQQFVQALGGETALPRVRKRSYHRAAIGVATFGVVGTVGWIFATRDANPRSLAVIPCRTTVEDTSRRYLGEIADDLLSEVSRRHLFTKVIALASSQRYRESAKSPMAIGAELGADALLYCTYRQVGANEYLRTQLVRGSDGALLWTGDVDRRLASSDEAPLSTMAVNQLAQRVAPSASRALAAPGMTSTNIRALNAFREGRYWVKRLDLASLQKSIALFNEAIALDSGFADAYLGRAQAHFLLGIAHGDLDEYDAFTLMQADVVRAQQLNPLSAEGERKLAATLGVQWRWDAASQHLRRALELDPNLTQAYSQLAFSLSWQGRYNDAFEASARSIELSPVDPLMWSNASVYYTLAGQYDTAVARSKRALVLSPDYHAAHWALGAAYAELGRYDEAIEHLKHADSLSRHQIGFIGHLGYAYGLKHDTTSARALLRELLGLAAKNHTLGKTAASLALVYIGLGQRDSAFHWMNVAADRKSFLLVSNLMAPATSRVADDPRYDALLERVHLPRPPRLRETSTVPPQSPTP